ncbi:MAG TPA: hypothetical protein VGG10_18225 [Rhizomicrobium sp.]
MPESEPRTTYFGLWPKRKLETVSTLLNELGVRYEVTEFPTDRETLVNWEAWDSSADNPMMGYDLWIFTDDLPKIGTRIVELFPERKFDGPDG